MLLLFVLVAMYHIVCAEVVMRETRIDPFTFLFEKQNLLIEKLDTVLDRMDSLEITNKHHLNDVLAKVENTEKKIDEINHIVLTVSGTLDIVTNELSASKTREVQNDGPKIVDCNCSDTHKSTEPEVVDDTSSILNSVLFNDIYDDTPDYNDSVNGSCVTGNQFNSGLLKLSKSLHNVTQSKILEVLSNGNLQKYIDNSMTNQIDNLRESLFNEMNAISDNINKQKESFIELTKYLLNTNQFGDSPIDFTVDSHSQVLNDSDVNNSTDIPLIDTSESASITSLFTRISQFLTPETSPVEISTTQPPSIPKCPECKNPIPEKTEDLSDIVHQIHTTEEVISNSLTKTEEQILGFKIYQSSAFYSQMKEIRYELGKVKESLLRTAESTGSKLSRKLDSNKLSLFTFIDAAVTSITSSCVTSSQATGMAIAKTLRNIFHHVHMQMKEVSWYGAPDCPGMYQKIGSKCLLVLETVKTTWAEACHICSSLGGRVVASDLDTEIQLLGKMLNPETTGFWMKPFNSSETCGVAEEKISELPTTVDCESFFTNGTGISTAPCDSSLPVVCQHNHFKCNNGEIMNRKFNITNAVSDLDYFLRNSKYFQF